MRWINVNSKLPTPDDENIPCNEYYLVRIEGYGWGKAMFIEGVWYASYWAQVNKPVTHWMKIDEPN